MTQFLHFNKSERTKLKSTWLIIFPEDTEFKTLSKTKNQKAKIPKHKKLKHRKTKT